jgi:hypothetical protein
MKQYKMEETTMKTSILFRSSVLASCAAVAVLSFLAPKAALADGKGASLLMPAKTLTTASQPHNSSTQPAMACPRCKDGLATVRETNPKGMRVASVKSVPVHLCPTCETRISSVGTGKAKTDKVTHTCGNSANTAASCCMASK